MSPEEKELFKRSIALAEENNDMLRAIQRHLRLTRLMTAVYWLFIIGSAIGAFYLAQPYIHQFSAIYNGAKSSLGL
jgi:hypothetical protein